MSRTLMLAVARYAIAILEAVGGGLGLYVTIHALVAGAVAPATLVILSVGLFGASLAAGLLLMGNAKGGIGLSVIVQILQIPLIQVMDVGYRFAAGLQVSGGATLLAVGDETRFSFALTYGRASVVSIMPVPPPVLFMLGVNMVAVLVLVLLRLIERHRPGDASQGSSRGPSPGSSQGPSERMPA